MDGVYEDIEEYNRNKKRKILIAFDDMIADILSNKKKHNPTVTELFIRGRKSNISLVYITQSSFALAKKKMLNSAHYFMMSIPRKLELQQSAFNHSSCISFRNFTTLWKHVPQNRIHF